VGLVAVAVTAALGLLVDTNEKLTAASATAIKAAGAGTVMRYGPLPGMSAAGDLDLTELTLSAKAGLVVCVIQHPRLPEYNVLSAATGLGDAQHLVAWAKTISFVCPDIQLSLGLDMEGVKNAGPDSFAHALAWVKFVRSAGYRALVYCGYDPGLTSAQCDQLAMAGADVRFWCDAGPYEDRPAPSIGYAWKQHLPSKLAGVDVDRNDVLQDGVVWGLGWVDDVPADPDDPAIEPSPDTLPTGAPA